MFYSVRFAAKLRRLQALKRRIDAEFRPQIEAARDRGDRDAKNELYSKYQFEIDLVEDEIAELQTKRLTELAQRLLIPTPPLDFDAGQWLRSEISGKLHLSPEASHSLRSEIRRERKERRDMWLPLIAAIISIIGAVVSWWKAFS